MKHNMSSVSPKKVRYSAKVTNIETGRIDVHKNLSLNDIEILKSFVTIRVEEIEEMKISNKYNLEKK